mgnify:CR=1 FL=1
MPHFQRLKVAELRRETADAVSIEFAVPAELRDQFAYRQGQHLTLRREIDGEDLRRNYSICSSAQEQRLRVAIKRVAGGRFSNWALDELRVGDQLQVLAPTGHFYTALEPSQRKHYLGIAAGSGITPIISNLKTLLAAEPHSRCTLIYANRSSASVLFLEALEDLKNAYPERFHLIHVFSREEGAIELFCGRLDRDRLAALLDGPLAGQRPDECFLCGPEGLIDCAREVLVARGIDAAHIHFELFTTSAAGRAAAAARQARGLSGEQAEQISRVGVILDGQRSDLRLRRGDQSILDAALQVRGELPFACKGGVCCTCRARVIEGEVEMDVNYGLEADEIAAGYVLTCQAHPVSDVVVVDFDR